MTSGELGEIFEGDYALTNFRSQICFDKGPCQACANNPPKIALSFPLGTDVYAMKLCMLPFLYIQAECMSCPRAIHDSPLPRPY